MRKITSYNQNQANLRDELYTNMRKENNYVNTNVNSIGLNPTVNSIGLDQHSRHRGYNLGNTNNSNVGNRLRRLQSYQV